MGRTKALLPFGGATLLDHVASQVLQAAGSVTLIGPPETYAHLGYAIIADQIAGLGPLSGIRTALNASRSEWNLIVACDMPLISSNFLSSLLDSAAVAGADCLLPTGPSGHPEPLCAVYHRRCLPVIARSLAGGIRKVTDGLAGLRIEMRRTPESRCFANCNTPQEWSSFLDG